MDGFLLRTITAETHDRHLALNSRATTLMMAEFARRARRYGEPLSLIMLDVDRVKDYNDSFGHLAGNSVLKQLAEVLREHTRETNLVARFGGEEFALILPHTEAAEAVALAERLRDAIGVADWSVRRVVTASFGVCVLTPELDGPDMLVARADSALYYAKVARWAVGTGWWRADECQTVAVGDAK